MLSAAQFASANNISSLAYFTPTIIHSFGYSPTATQLYSVPPLSLAFLTVLGVSYLSDRYQVRGMATICCAALSALGFAIFYASSDYRVRYGSLFISSPGAYAVMPTLSAWASNNSEPYKRKASTIGLGSMAGSIGSLLSVWVFVLGRPPRYHLPTGLSLAL
ncbi:hypothetical protein PGTUg99_034034 [Puccinia graminis f. sp. tritici]|nr:hypothetical protein PGTUg99_034034 [Puccinia graminis f. sp. tritici]